MSTYIIVFLILLISLFLYMVIEAFRNRLSINYISLKDFPKNLKGIKILFISDIHRRNVSKSLIEKLDEPPDLVVIGGDLAERGVPFQRVEKNVKLFTSLAPTFFIWGNNDYGTDYRQLDVLLQNNGVKILDNTVTCFEAGESRLNLIGLDDCTSNRDRLDLAMQDIHSGYNILLSHNPNIVRKENLPQYHIKLVLSGHTHGGQIRILNWGIRESGGLKCFKGVPYFISNGYGYRHLPLRFGARSEANLIILQ